MSDTPIADYALLSDCHGAALVDRHGSVDWLCFPRFDAPAQFCRLLDPAGGHWAIRPAGPCETVRRYLEGSLILETCFRTPTGELTLRDALAVGLAEEGHALGAGSPHVLMRQARCTAGAVTVAIDYAPRPEYGLLTPLLRAVEGGILARGGASVLLLCAAIPLAIGQRVAHADVTLKAGERLNFALQYRDSAQSPPQPWDDAAIEARLADTLRAWQSWSDMHQGYYGPWREHVLLSGRLLQGLTYYPTGAIIAAPTTSLPENVGGSRNWDYRYTWVRDASLTLEALWIAACPDESHRFFDFMANSALAQIRGGRDMQIMFGVGGEHDLSERELPHLRGWRESRPVRIGNAAWSQRQHDVYGELTAAAYRLKDVYHALDPVTAGFLAEVADFAAERWREKDQGIWEIRGPPRHFLYSKLMCWVALDRAIGMADRLGAGERVAYWRGAREAIRAAILGRGWSRRAQAFTQAFGTDHLDASALMIPIVGLLPADDPRMRATIRAIERGLTDPHGLVFRYRTDNGLQGGEGAFLICTFWLAHVQALAGDVEQAERTFVGALRHANDVGLLAEEICPRTGELLGNFPQAFSHIGLINAAWAIHEARQRRGSGSGNPPWPVR